MGLPRLVFTITRLMITSIIYLKISPYTPQGVYCEMYPSLEGNTEEFNSNNPLLRIIFWIVQYSVGGQALGPKIHPHEWVKALQMSGAGNALQYSTVLYCTVTVQYSQYSTVQYSIVNVQYSYCTVRLLYSTITILSAIKAYNGYQPCPRVLWINPTANIIFSTVGI